MSLLSSYHYHTTINRFKSYKMSQMFGNTTNGTVIWQDEPSKRGTGSILSTCLITTSLCIWTAVHLNVPRMNPPYWGTPHLLSHCLPHMMDGRALVQLLRKVGWLILGLIAPEMVVYTAWHQHREARSFQKWVNKKLDKDEKVQLRHLTSQTPLT